MEFIDNECSVSSDCDTSSQKSTTEDEKLIDESSLDSYDSSFIDDLPSEEQTDKVCKL